MSLPDNQYELPWLESRYATIKPGSVLGEKYFTCKHHKPPWTNTPENFEHVAHHFTSPSMNFRPVVLKKKNCYLREFTAESSLIFTINPSNFTLF